MFCHAKCTSTARLSGKTALITGSNTGIGKYTAQDFYKRGARVIMACRDMEKAEQAAADIRQACEGEQDLGSIAVMKLDLSNLESVREFAGEVLKDEPRLDILVNNAGVMVCPEGKTADGFETQFGTNHLGHFLLTLLLLPKIVQSAPARVVNVSSVAHTGLSGGLKLDDLNWEKRSYSPIQAYSQSKLANILFTKELARKLQEANVKGVTTYALHPGLIATDLYRHVDDTMVTGSGWLYRNFGHFFMKTTEQGAQTTIYCSVDEKAGQESGLYYAECKVKEPSSNAKNMEYAKKLWDVSAKMVGLSEDYNCFRI